MSITKFKPGRTRTIVPSQRPGGKPRSFKGSRYVSKTQAGEYVIQGEKLPASIRSSSDSSKSTSSELTSSTSTPLKSGVGQGASGQPLTPERSPQTAYFASSPRIVSDEKILYDEGVVEQRVSVSKPTSVYGQYVGTTEESKTRYITPEVETIRDKRTPKSQAQIEREKKAQRRAEFELFTDSSLRNVRMTESGEVYADVQKGFIIPFGGTESKKIGDSSVQAVQNVKTEKFVRGFEASATAVALGQGRAFNLKPVAEQSALSQTKDTAFIKSMRKAGGDQAVKGYFVQKKLISQTRPAVSATDKVILSNYAPYSNMLASKALYKAPGPLGRYGVVEGPSAVVKATSGKPKLPGVDAQIGKGEVFTGETTSQFYEIKRLNLFRSKKASLRPKTEGKPYSTNKGGRLRAEKLWDDVGQTTLKSGRSSTSRFPSSAVPKGLGSRPIVRGALKIGSGNVLGRGVGSTATNVSSDVSQGFGSGQSSRQGFLTSQFGGQSTSSSFSSALIPVSAVVIGTITSSKLGFGSGFGFGRGIPEGGGSVRPPKFPGGGLSFDTGGFSFGGSNKPRTRKKTKRTPQLSAQFIKIQPGRFKGSFTGFEARGYKV